MPTSCTSNPYVATPRDAYILVLDEPAHRLEQASFQPPVKDSSSQLPTVGVPARG